MAVWFVFHDGFAVAGRFGELDVASDAGVEYSDVGPGAILIALSGEEAFDVADDFSGEAGAAVEHAKDQAGDPEVAVDSFLEYEYRFEQLA